MTGRRRADARAAQDVRWAIDAAAAAACPLVKVLDARLRPGGLFGRGWTRDAAIRDLAAWLVPLGDHAAGRG